MYAHQLREKTAEWLKVREAEGLRPATIRAYKDHIHIFCLWLDGKELTPANFADFFHQYAEGHSPASCRTIYTSMRAFLRGIDRDELMGKMKRPQGDTPPKTIYSDGQMQALWAVLQADRTVTGLRDHAFVALLYYTGLRISEVCALRIDDLSPESGGSLQVRGGKSRYARRVVPLVAPVQQILSDYLGRARPRLVYHHSDALFLSTGGVPMTRDAARTMLRRRGDQAGFPVSAHRFRHGWVTQHVKSRSSPALLGALAGWSPKTLFDMMMRYSHPEVEDLRRTQQQAFAGNGADLPRTRRPAPTY